MNDQPTLNVTGRFIVEPHCFFRTTTFVAVTLDSLDIQRAPISTRTTTTTESQRKHSMKVLDVYHSVDGQLARAVEEGVKSVSGVEAVFRRAPEFPHTEKELEADEGHASKIWQAQKNTPACTLI